MFLMPQFFLAFLFLFLSGTSFGAESQYWISVGSFKTEAKAAQTARGYEEEFTDKFSVVGSNTNKGFFYRVALGPYANKNTAQDRLDELEVWVCPQAGFGLEMVEWVRQALVLKMIFQTIYIENLKTIRPSTIWI
jgi:hypothetical protein